ncbi:aldehyde reductase [Devosia neptuniae]|jgi:nucleoside-diphosphate-sugar epimerase|uniref:SDR family oxidoreductase n=1 Tax=Devosia TaxID=46913 RepID=UPI0022AFD288|nr:aldehyde reductase [Devosia neptuniae]MCZ4347653.1 aldehyde reductase [Devosia neptuniae]|tara:strand:- start:27273 stop:28286 length:1014 start_codon:yes stop_codon:yes gene_type:complete
MSDRVLLTGVSGFLGGHVALQLLNAGYTVRGSVRKLAKADKVRATLARAGADISRLELVALDLLSDDGWAEAMADVRYVQHTASPFVLNTPSDPQELIRPAVEGTRRAIAAALAAKVERIVLTSSIAAIQYGQSDTSRAFTEADWSNVDSPHIGAYAQSKTLAERAAWEMMDAAGRHDDLAVINPAGIFGPLLDEDPGTSSMLVQRLLDGKLPAVPKLAMSMVDVRDVAALQVDAMTNPAAGGQRCIASEGTYMMAEVGKMLVPAFPDRRVPTAELPNWVVRIVALFDRDVRDNMHEMGTVKRVDGKRGSERLGRPLIGTDVSSIATGKSLVEHGLV